MSGHSKWSKIKHQKAITDVQKGKIFSKMAKIIAVAARDDGDPEMNSKLRIAIEKAQSVNMPRGNIERAIKKGTGKLGGEKIEEVVYEAYGPSGVALIIEAITDNKNRTLSEIKNILGKHSGRLGDAGSVKWLFEKRGVLELEISEEDNLDDLEMEIIDAGAEDIKKRDNILEIQTKPTELNNVKNNLETKGIKVESANLEWMPKNPVKIEDEKNKIQIEKLFEALDEQNDIQEIYSNLEKM
jgi:YebC/PmpR family DNA-binding regulatory protein